MIIDELFEEPQQCPECGGISFSDLILAEKKDACYYKVKASAKVWPSAYASGRLVQCRKKGAANYGNKSKGVAEGRLNEDATRAEAQAAYMQGECMILAVAINQLNPERYPIGYIWEYNMSAGVPDMQLDDDEWESLSPQEQQEISKDISRHSVVHAYVRDRDTGEYIDARGRHKTLPNLWGRLGQTRFEEFPGTARELIDITAHGDWDEVGQQVSFKRGQPAFDSLAGPAGIKRAQEYAVKYLGVEGSKNKTPGTDQQGVAEGEVIPFKRPQSPTAVSWQKLPKDVLTLANDWFWADYEGSGLDATMDPKGLGSGFANQQKYLGAQLQQRGWAIDIDDEFENVVLKNKQGQTILLPIEDAQTFSGWSKGTNPVTEQGMAEAKPTGSRRDPLDLPPLEGPGGGGGAGGPSRSGPSPFTPVKIPGTNINIPGVTQSTSPPPVVTRTPNINKQLDPALDVPAYVRKGLPDPVTAPVGKPKITVRPGETQSQAMQRTQTEKEFGKFLQGQGGQTFGTAGAGRGSQGGPTASQATSDANQVPTIKLPSGQTIPDPARLSPSGQYNTQSKSNPEMDKIMKTWDQQQLAGQSGSKDAKPLNKVSRWLLGIDEETSRKKRQQPEVDYDNEYDAMVARVKKLAGLGPLKTVYDPAKRQYRNMPTAVQPKK